MTQHVIRISKSPNEAPDHAIRGASETRQMQELRGGIGERWACRVHTAVAELGHDSGVDRLNLFYVQGGRARGAAYAVNLLEVPPLTFRGSRLCSGYGWFKPISRPFAQKFVCSNSGAVVGTGVVRVLRLHVLF